MVAGNAAERMIGAGDLIIESAGERGQETFSNIPKPSAVQNEIYRQMEASKNRDADRMAGRRELSVPEQLEKLDELRQLITSEFDEDELRSMYQDARSSASRPAPRVPQESLAGSTPRDERG